MQYSKQISTSVQAGRITYTTRPFVPLPVVLRSVAFQFDGLPAGSQLSYDLAIDGTHASAGTCQVGVPVTFPSGIRLSSGGHEIRAVVGVFHQKRVTGRFVAETSFF